MTVVVFIGNGVQSLPENFSGELDRESVPHRGDTVGHFRGESDEILELLHLIVECLRLRPLQILRLRCALVQQSERGIDLTSLPLAGYDRENLPYILFRLVEITAVAFHHDHPHESPVHKLLQVRVGVAAAGGELLHDLVRTHRLRRGH